ncbi:hypothetical protein L917_01438 [Phytophthora nicotianae]|uniref:Uncharacterized protein n=1 Tax=Phytophthora nicotianae TaxID=4792 RepID=W2LWZ3_PHYNI|nr:hypothetical protein L917_01438 [Phytophthora nicotianae]
MDDLPIIELPEHYRIDGEKLGMALAHRVAAREEAEARCQALVLVFHPAYGGPSTLELRVDARIQDVLQQLQHWAQEQARALAEAQLTDQAALPQLMERRMDAALQQIEQKASLRTDRHIQVMRENMHKYVEDRFQEAIRGSDDNALPLVRGELKIRRADHHDSIARSEARVVELVRGILNQYDSATRVRQE